VNDVAGIRRDGIDPNDFMSMISPLQAAGLKCTDAAPASTRGKSMGPGYSDLHLMRADVG
jgi:hypothetical protein